MNAERHELVIGLEVHCQLKTHTKVFCGCRTTFGDAPNANTCPVCLGLPGALPVLNRHAVELATRTAFALGCTVHATSVFARKNYFYPDLPKGYQITQFDRPIATRGVVSIGSVRENTTKDVRITRVHMEEDAGKSVHDRFAGVSAVDLNRAGTPLVEIVSEPDIRSASEAGAYLRALKQILEYTEVSDANMEEGSLRVDVNVSVRRHGSTTLGTRTEIKNLNTFSGVERAIEVEFARQCALVDRGGVVEQQTMIWDAVRGEIRPTRSKEASHDYRYFPEPDLPPLMLDLEWMERQRSTLPELPSAKRIRFETAYGLGPSEIEQLTAMRDVAHAFELVTAECGDPKRAANWVLGPLLGALNASHGNISEYPVSPKQLGALIRLEASGAVSNTAARQLFAMLETEDTEPAALAQREGLLKVSDDVALLAWIDAVFVAHPAEAARFALGETKLQGVLVGFVMKESKGAADPRRVNQLLTARSG